MRALAKSSTILFALGLVAATPEDPDAGQDPFDTAPVTAALDEVSSQRKPSKKPAPVEELGSVRLPPRREGLRSEDVRRVVSRHAREVKLCFEKRLQEKPGVQGKLVVQFVIDAAGRVSSTQRGAGSTLEDTPLEDCILKATRRWVFPAPGEAAPVTVVYPFVLRTEP